jgi:predicted GIY-YIG superfamily endonuclease
MITYIIECSSGEYYCGKTNDLQKRIIEHSKEKYPKWFCTRERKIFQVVIIIKGDYEKYIKRAGIKEFVECFFNASASG